MIHAFADDSVMQEIVVCAAMICDEAQVADAEAVLAKAKASVGVEPSVALHCRELFSGDARRGTAWERVPRPAIDHLVEKLCRDLQRVQERPVVAPIRQRDVPDQHMDPEGPMQRLHVKGIASFTYHAVIVNLHDRFRHQGFRLWIDPDKTMIPWGSGRRRADTTRRIYADVSAGSESPLIEPIVEYEPKPALLQIADLYAYVTGRGLSAGEGGRQNAWFRDRLIELNPELMRFEWAKDSKWEDIRRDVPK